MNRSNVLDENDSIFRSSMRGFFTGKNKQSINKSGTFNASSYSTQGTNEHSTLVSNNDVAFSGNPIKALKFGRKNMFSNYGSSESLKAKGIEELMSDFNKDTRNFNTAMQNVDVSERLKQNHNKNKLQEFMETPDKYKTNSLKIPKGAIALSAKKFARSTLKGMPIKADHIFKKSMIRKKTQNS
jgi:hypothetical protein